MIIEIKVTPGSKKQTIEKKDNIYKITTLNIPQKGKVNKELIEIISSYFDVSKNQVHIKHGLKSRNKIIEII